MDGFPSEQVRTVLRWLKDSPPGAIPIAGAGKSFGLLQAVTWEDAGDGETLARLSQWHESAFAWFPEPFAVSPMAARRWLVDQVLPDPDRILFWVRDVRGGFIGHVGLTRFDAARGTAVLGDVVADHPTHDGLLALAAQTLTGWAQEALGVQVGPAAGQAAA